jgi:hypothetical protein
MTTPFKDACPECGHRIDLATLKEMAVGDGWERYLLVRDAAGVERFVSFDEFQPYGMTPISERVSSLVELPECVAPSV